MRAKTILGIGLSAFVALAVFCIRLHAPSLAAARTGKVDAVSGIPPAAETAAATPAAEATKMPAAEPSRTPAATRRPTPRSSPPVNLQVAIDAVLSDRPIEFALGRATLTLRSRRTLDQLVPLLGRNPRARIRVSSHTDAWGGAAHNRLLSQKRADAVVAYFVRNGLDRKRFTAIGYGETRPMAKALTAADMAKNRRTEIRVAKGR